MGGFYFGWGGGVFQVFSEFVAINHEPVALLRSTEGR